MAVEQRALTDTLFDKLEVDIIGVVRLEDWKDTPMWQDARKLLPGARSVIVLAQEVFPEVVKFLTSKSQKGELSLRDLFYRNRAVVNGYIDGRAYRLVKNLHRAGLKGLPLPAADAPIDSRFIETAFSYGAAARAAGIGVQGWHSMLITPEYGPRVRLCCVLTDAPLEPSVPEETAEYPCVKCGGACVKICPAGAIAVPEDSKTPRINKFACRALVNAAGGCAECVKVCPTGKKVGV